MQFCAVQEFLHFSFSGVFFNYLKYYVPPSDCIPVITFSSVRLHKYQESPVYAVGKALITNDEPTCASLLKMFMLSSIYYHATHDAFQYFRKQPFLGVVVYANHVLGCQCFLEKISDLFYPFASPSSWSAADFGFYVLVCGGDSGGGGGGVAAAGGAGGGGETE